MCRVSSFMLSVVAALLGVLAVGVAQDPATVTLAYSDQYSTYSAM